MSHTVCTKCNNYHVYDDKTVCKFCTIHFDVIDELEKILKEGQDYETASMRAVDKIMESRVKLGTTEIRQLCQIYFNARSKTQDSLQDCNLLFQEMDHARNINQPVEGFVYV